MPFREFTEGPLLWIISLLFITGIVIRIVLYLYSIVRKILSSDNELISKFIIPVKAILPYHMAATKKPIYTALLYVFHGSLFIVPLFYSGHIILWEESRLQLSLPTLPDAWADILSVIIIGILLFFVFRRFFSRHTMVTTKWTDALLILITSLPFISGYFLAHGLLNHIPFFNHNMSTIHILSAEVLFLMAIPLMCRPFINSELCTGCAACEINCMIGALSTTDWGNQRNFFYVPSQCISCGQCAITCPENAVSLRHSINIKGLFQGLSKKVIRDIDLSLCEICGAPVGPVPQIEKIISQLDNGAIRFCSQCREEELAKIFCRTED